MPGISAGGAPAASASRANVVIADLLWAIRGAGPGFFGVVTQYRLKTRPAPRAITACDYFYPLDRVDAAGAWAASIAGKMPRVVELTLLCTATPAALAAQAKSSNGYVALLTATVFADTKIEAAAALAPLEGGPASLGLLSKNLDQPMTMNGLLDLGGEFWQEHHRYRADTLWTNTPPAQPLAVMRDRFLSAPSPISLGLCVFATRQEGDALPDAAFSMTAKNLIVCYAIWQRPRRRPGELRLASRPDCGARPVRRGPLRRRVRHRDRPQTCRNVVHTCALPTPSSPLPDL